MDKLRNEYNRMKRESQEKVDKLSERIKELNQRLLSEA
jgi:wobble nucleotide-excising tRNase